MLFHAIDPAEVAGVVIEPVLGSGGVVVPPDGFWTALTALCEEHDWLLCLDEVKTGFGRTGRLFAAELWDLQPDLMCLGKAMGGGVMPIGAVLGSDAVLGTFDDVSTGSTWAWLPAACAVALRSLDVFENEGVLENVRALHDVSMEVLTPLVDRYEQIGDVRVQGCFVGIELVTDKGSQNRAADLQEALAAAILRRGILVDSSTTTLNVQPSLVMPTRCPARGARAGLRGRRRGARRLTRPGQRRRRRFASRSTSRAALRPLAPLTPPPGCVPAPHR